MNDINHIWGPYLAMLQQEGNLADLYYKVKDNRVSPNLDWRQVIYQETGIVENI